MRKLTLAVLAVLAVAIGCDRDKPQAQQARAGDISKSVAQLTVANGNTISEASQ